MKLKFSKGNAKLNKTIHTFSLPAGTTCPGAYDCRSMAVEKNGQRVIVDGKHTKFRCFAASQEVLYRNTFNARKFNLDLLAPIRRSVAKMAELIQASLPKRAKYIRIHVGGDFFNVHYMEAWARVARENPRIIFYAYTKSIPTWGLLEARIPSNFILTASLGGKWDTLAETMGLRTARVVFTEEEAARLNLEIDHDDSLAISHGPSFALLLHGVQPKDSKAAAAWTKLRKAGKSGYSKKKLKVVYV